jgi:hypothetical protein
MQLQRQRPRVSRDTADFVEYQRTRDRRLRDRLVNEHIGLAYSTAGRLRVVAKKSKT